MHPDLDNQLSGAVIGAAIAVHRELGPGLDEPYYQRALSEQLKTCGLQHHPQFPLPLYYKGEHLDCGYRPDFVFPGRLVIEIKSVEVLLPVHDAQLITYLRLTQIGLGLLINFDVPTLRDGIRRRILTSQTQQHGNPTLSVAPVNDLFEPISCEVLNAAVEVHRELGPGLLPSAYERCLCHELSLRRIPFQCQQPVQIRHGGVDLLTPIEVPLVVDRQLPVVCLAVDELSKLREIRLLSLLRHGHWRSGLLFNFNVLRMQTGVRRIVNPELRPRI